MGCCPKVSKSWAAIFNPMQQVREKGGGLEGACCLQAEKSPCSRFLQEKDVATGKGSKENPHGTGNCAKNRMKEIIAEGFLSVEGNEAIPRAKGEENSRLLGVRFL